MTSKADSSISTALIDTPHSTDEIIVSFVGPFSWFGAPDAPCVYYAEEAHEPGVYLWTVPQPEGQLIYYVGESGRTMGARLRQHYKEMTGARYNVFFRTRVYARRKSLPVARPLRLDGSKNRRGLPSELPAPL